MASISWVFMVIALYGTYLNSNQNKKGFYFWIVSNIFFSLLNFFNGQYALCLLFFIYFVLAVRGLEKWK